MSEYSQTVALCRFIYLALSLYLFNQSKAWCAWYLLLSVWWKCVPLAIVVAAVCGSGGHYESGARTRLVVVYFSVVSSNTHGNATLVGSRSPKCTVGEFREILTTKMFSKLFFFWCCDINIRISRFNVICSNLELLRWLNMSFKNCRNLKLYRTDANRRWKKKLHFDS